MRYRVLKKRSLRRMLNEFRDLEHYLSWFEKELLSTRATIKKMQMIASYDSTAVLSDEQILWRELKKRVDIIKQAKVLWR